MTATGNPEFKIMVEFDCGGMSSGSRPMSCTCVKTLVLPGGVCSTRDFESKLDEAVMSLDVVPFMIN